MGRVILRASVRVRLRSYFFFLQEKLKLKAHRKKMYIFPPFSSILGNQARTVIGPWWVLDSLFSGSAWATFT